MMLLRCAGCKDSQESPRLEPTPIASSSFQRHGSQRGAKEKFGYQTLNLNLNPSAARICGDSPTSQSSHTMSGGQSHCSNSSTIIPSTMPIVDLYKKSKALSLWLEGDETTMGLPDGEIANFQSFCPPKKWSAAFASTGDFTIKASHVKRSKGTIIYHLALVGLPIASTMSPHHHSANIPRSRTEDSFILENSVHNFPLPRKDKVQVVSVITKTDTDIAAFVYSMALRCPGHKLVAMYSRKMERARKLEDRIEAVVEILSYILSITHIGVHQLIAVKESIPQDIRARVFLSLHYWGANMGPLPGVGSNSCDGRLESQSDKPVTHLRKPIPSEWLLPPPPPSTSTNVSLKASTSGSIRHSISSSSVNRVRKRSYPQIPMPFCTTYVPPMEWHKHSASIGGSFTVQLTGIHAEAGDVVQYILTILYSDQTSAPPSVLTRTVAHRYQEFWALGSHVQEKTKLNVLQYLPPKTFLRSADPAFLESRSLGLQKFLDNLLTLSFMGMLDQKIDMAAEPQVRAFLQLPPVQWNVVAEHPSKRELDRFRALSNSSTASSRSISPLKQSDDEDDDEDDHDIDDGDEHAFAEFESLIDRPFPNRRSISSQHYPVTRGVA